MTKTRSIAVVALLALAGCSQLAETDRRIVWDSNGCAYYVRHAFLAVSKIYPLKEANKATCEVSHEQ